jgi:peptidoglycan hydrolase-like protein with peptidoglycan-binding domain
MGEGKMDFALTWLPDILLAAGLKVAEQPGWRTRGRREMGRIRGVMCHHTAGAGPEHGVMPSLGVITNGRPATATTKALSGPLAQLGLGRDGTYFVIAAGLANHAGPGAWRNVTTGNESFIGIEAENRGDGVDPWPEVQLDAYHRGVAAILKKIGASADMCCGHKEFALPLGRKPDPRNIDMLAFRARVAAIMDDHANVRPLIPAIDTKDRPTLRRDDTGEFVVQVQRMLGLPVDGIFGVMTEAAARQFQRAHDLVPDGIVGPKTWAALDLSFPA